MSVESHARLGLGTAQFGTEYGVSNTNGKPSLHEVQAILDLAAHHGVKIIDTAPAYGTSEEVLGKCLADDHPFKIVTKTRPLGNSAVRESHARGLAETFHESLKRLRQKSVYGFLVHHADDLLCEGGEQTFEAMLSLQNQGLVQRIGVSVYTKSQIDQVLRRFAIDLIQVPLNVFDQRLVRSGHLAILKRRGIEVHVRSVFLQGLLLMPPESLNSYFEHARPRFREYARFLKEKGLTRLEGSLSFVAGLPEVDAMIVGITSAAEMRQVLEAVTARRLVSAEFARIACDDEKVINPSRWRLVK